MARGLNKVILIGNLGADPEIKYAASGTAIANLRLATSENRKNREGEWEDITEWHRITMFGKQAETCKDYLRKGSKIYIEGRIQTRSWDDKNGQKQYMTEIVGNTMIMLDSRGQDSSQQGSNYQKPQQDGGGSGKAPPPPPDFPQGDDDLPF
ncbi:single-stranded DNA-binding protein [Candidatus Latescibacterota bacterium]